MNQNRLTKLTAEDLETQRQCELKQTQIGIYYLIETKTLKQLKLRLRSIRHKMQKMNFKDQSQS